MPYHRIPAASIHEDTRTLEHEGERIVSATLEGGYFHVFTEYERERTELRTLTHQARTGVAG